MLIAFFKSATTVLALKTVKKKKACFNVINPNLFGLFAPALPHISASPHFLSAHTTALTLSASLTCWQQFVSRYQFSASRLRGREGCGNHLYLRLLGSVPPRHAGRHLPLSGCQAERVWDVGSSCTGHGHFFPKATEAKTLSGIWAIPALSVLTLATLTRRPPVESQTRLCLPGGFP